VPGGRSTNVGIFTNSAHLGDIKILPTLDHWSAFFVHPRQQCCLLCKQCSFIISYGLFDLLGTIDKSVQSRPNADSSESWIRHHHALRAMSLSSLFMNELHTPSIYWDHLVMHVDSHQIDGARPLRGFSLASIGSAGSHNSLRPRLQWIQGVDGSAYLRW